MTAEQPMLSRRMAIKPNWCATALLSISLLGVGVAVRAEDAVRNCDQDTMIVFDASGSMGGTDMNSVTPRIAKVREAIARVLPEIPPARNLGLMIYGPGATSKCESIELRLKPQPNAAGSIIAEVNSIVPAGRTPLTAAVREAADILDYKKKPATIVLVTDGEETCGGDPCNLAGILESSGKGVTVHVIGYRDPIVTKGVFGSRCLAEVTGGKYISVETTDELADALRSVLGCDNLSGLTPNRVSIMAPWSSPGLPRNR